MKKIRYKGVLDLYFKFAIVLLVLIGILLGIGVYVLNIHISNENRSSNWSSWPAYFTTNFYKEISFQNGNLKLTDSAIEDIEKYKLILQIIDKNGDVILGYNEQKGISKHYSPIEMVQLYKTGGKINNYTMFVGSVDNNGEEYAYIIGFPAKISKVTMYLNHDNYLNVKFVLLGLFILFIIIVTVYGIVVNHTLSNIVTGIRRIAANTSDSSEEKGNESFVPLKEKGMYKDVFSSLNFLDRKLKANEKERKRNEALREEWIANISHDLKTPLSPIKGYAEILSDSEYTVVPDEVKKYGEIIFRNAENVEDIVENLNFTYQLKNGMLPLKRIEGNIVRTLREIVIDILNHPQYEEKNIIFKCTEERVNFNFDAVLIKRAFTNLLYNSVIHNSKETMIEVSIKKEDKIYIKIEDNGKGMTEEEVEKLFERYYRGTNSSEDVKGSGLGMAIAKQIIEAHEGKINVMSRVNVGTSIKIEFPINE